VEQDLDVDAFIALLADSGLGERRPIDDRARIAKMLAKADLIVTARIDGELVGVARTLSDFAYCSYLADLAVAERCKGQGIGKALIAETRARIGPGSMLLLIAAPTAQSYYEHIGMPRVDSAFLYPREV
jgi:GNAT superfamily N-acetyltransferase